MKAALESVLIGGSERNGDGSNNAASGFETGDVEILQAGEHEAVALDDQARSGGQRDLAEESDGVEQAVALVVYSGMTGGSGELQGDAEVVAEGDRHGVDPAAGAVAAPQLGRPQRGHVLQRVVVGVGAGHGGELIRVVAHRRLALTVNEPVCSQSQQQQCGGQWAAGAASYYMDMRTDSLP